MRTNDGRGQLFITSEVCKKKRVTAGEVDKLGKEVGNCTHQWTTNDDKNKQALSTLSLLQVKQQKEERSREEDRREGGN